MVIRDAVDSSLAAIPVNIFVLSLMTTTENRVALPKVERTVLLAEKYHAQLVGRAAKGERIDCPELTGKSAFDQPLVGPHQHAHVLPVDLDGDRHLDHIIVYALGGLGELAQQAIRSVKRTWMKGGAGELQVAVVGCFQSDAAVAIDYRSQRLARLLAGEPSSTQWSSVTPFVPPRYVKKSGKNSLEGQVRAELESRGLPDADVDVLPSESIALRHFVRRRSRDHAQPPRDIGYSIRLRFGEPVAGPICLGYASHFGLGLFQTD